MYRFRGRVNHFSEFILLTFFGVFAGFINVMAGGGSTLTMPLLIFLGLDGATANGTNRVAVLFQNISAVRKFHREELYNLRTCLTFAAWALPGALLGAVTAVRIQDEWFQKILAAVILVVTLWSIRPPRITTHSEERRSKLIYPVLLLIGFYAGFIQAGVGFLLMAAFSGILHTGLIHANKQKVFIILATTLPSLLVFACTRRIHYGYAAALSIGNAFGGWWAVHLSLRKGEGIIRAVLPAAALLMSLKLFGLF